MEVHTQSRSVVIDPNMHAELMTPDIVRILGMRVYTYLWKRGLSCSCTSAYACMLVHLFCEVYN